MSFHDERDQQNGSQPEIVYAEDRDENDYCERGTQGCSVDHTHSKNDSECEGW